MFNVLCEQRKSLSYKYSAQILLFNSFAEVVAANLKCNLPCSNMWQGFSQQIGVEVNYLQAVYKSFCRV